MNAWHSNSQSPLVNPELHPWRLTWNIIMEVWKIIFLSKWVICMFHVNLPGCTQNASGTVVETTLCNLLALHNLNNVFKDGNDYSDLLVAVICKESKMHPVIGVDTCQHGFDAVLYTKIALINQSAKDFTVAFVCTKKVLINGIYEGITSSMKGCFLACFTWWVWSPKFFWFSNGCLIVWMLRPPSWVKQVGFQVGIH